MNKFKIVAEGDFACFTRPEFKVERVSYDVPTPGALEGMLKSIYWKPAIRYYIDKIIVFNPIDFLNIRRNEVSEKVGLQTIKSKIKAPSKDISIYTSESRNQRAAMILKNVKYGIEFHLEMTGIRSEQEDETEEKHCSILSRRLAKGQQFRTPCFGCREFPVRKILVVDDFDCSLISNEIKQMGEVDLGFMLYRMNFSDKGIPIDNNWSSPVFSDEATAVYYRPHMDNGVIDVAKYAKEIKC